MRVHGVIKGALTIVSKRRMTEIVYEASCSAEARIDALPCIHLFQFWMLSIQPIGNSFRNLRYFERMR
ncbi:hypothetical protein ROTAS13_02457 [Roseomonas sp. TAS13]|nr:hypothetical protein ROTAS13_02457 [Roseomonas sp. TAS13]